MWYVYALKCQDLKTYIGRTNDLKEKLLRRQNGLVPATVNRLPASFICYFAFKNKFKAFQFEKYLKSGSGIR